MRKTSMGRIARFARFARQVAPYLIFIVALASTVLVIILGFWAFLGPILGILIGSVLGIGNRIWGKEVNPAFPSKPLNWRIPVIVTSLFVVAMIFIYRPVLGFRPLAHYATFGLMSGFIAYEIYIGQSRWQVLSQLVIFVFLTYWSTQFTFPLGASAPDTTAFVPVINTIMEENHVTSSLTYKNTPGHMIYTASVVEIINTEIKHTYFVLSTVSLVMTTVLVGYVDRVIESINERTALYATLFFSITGFTLRRGLFPNKMNFFKPLIVIVIITTFALAFDKQNTRSYTLLGFVSIVALVVGHTYSTGAVIMVIFSIWVFNKISRLSGNLDYRDSFPVRTVTVFVLFAFTIFLGYSLFTSESIIRRLSGLALAAIELVGYYGGQASSGTSGGRYSALSIELLLFSTAGQIILFALGVAGVSVAFRFRDWAFDAINAWIAFGMGIIGFSVFVNAVDIPTPRIYALLGMFGLNIMMVVGLMTVMKAIPKRTRPSSAAVIIMLFAVLSLASPVAGVALSPVSDQVPHIRTYETAPNAETTEWSNKHIAGEYLTAQTTSTKLPMQKIGPQRASIDRARLQPGQLYIYTTLAAETGVIANTTAPALGGREYVYLSLPQKSENDNRIYSNGESSAYVKT